jgi:hypothetical protein
MRAVMRWRATPLDVGNSITAERRLGSSDHRRDTGRHAGGISNPAIDPRHDLMRLPARRCGFHGHRRGTSILSVRAAPRSTTVKFASRKIGSMCGGRVAFSLSRSTTSGAATL